MLYFYVRKVQFALSIELKKNTSFGLLHLSHWRLDLFCSWKMEWSHGKVMEKSLNFIPNFQYEPCLNRELQNSDKLFRFKTKLKEFLLL